MSIATRPPGPDLASGSRDGGEIWIGSSRPPKDLLPDGGNLAPAPAPAPERVLARDALHLLRLLRLNGMAPPWWRTQGATLDVETVRRQLDPIKSRRALAASYRREAFHDRLDQSADARSTAGAARIAYALRWLELGPDHS